MRKVVLTAALSSALTLWLVQSLGAGPEITRKAILENARVAVTERIIPPGGVRDEYIRPTDQVIVFLGEAAYERIDPTTGEKTLRQRQSGEVIWHSRGERAPKLVNVGRQPFRSLVIALK